MMNQKAREEALAGGISPLAYLLKILRDEEQAQATSIDAAKAAAPYVHARLATIEHSGDTEVRYTISAEPMTAEQWKREIEKDAPPLFDGLPKKVSFS
jgi:hypothetical protein